jgi:hypothetical protein
MSIYDIVSIVMSAIALIVAVITFMTGERRERERIQRERAAELRDRSGKPSTDYLGRNGRALQFQVTNVGKSHLLYLEPFLIDATEKIVARVARRFLPNVAPNERFDFEISPDAYVNAAELRLAYKWTDEAGEHKYVSNVEIPPR